MFEKCDRNISSDYTLAILYKDIHTVEKTIKPRPKSVGILRLSAPILLKLLAEISLDHSIHPRTEFFSKS
jgi:hypothetical protein